MTDHAATSDRTIQPHIAATAADVIAVLERLIREVPMGAGHILAADAAIAVVAELGQVRSRCDALAAQWEATATSSARQLRAAIAGG